MERPAVASPDWHSHSIANYYTACCPAEVIRHVINLTDVLLVIIVIHIIVIIIIIVVVIVIIISTFWSVSI